LWKNKYNDKEKRTMQIKDLLTLIGLLITIIIGIYNLLLLKGNRYISSVSAERMKWINNIRDLFSQYDKIAVLQITRFNELIHYKNTKIEDVSNELIYLNNHIELFLNPTEIVTVKLMEIQNSITEQLLNDFPLPQFNDKELSKKLLLLHYVQQVILKTEWKRIKKENKLGKEITDEDMNDMFKKTALSIDEMKYNLIFKSYFAEQVIKAFD
jgi:hypothetical protein